MKKNLYVFRHGQTEWNKLGKMQVTTDTSLTPLGIEQAKKIPEYLKDKNLGIIYGSHLKRAWKTGNIVAKELGVKIIKNEKLYEVFCGDVDGMTKRDLNKEFGENFVKRWKGLDPEDDNMKFPNGESKLESRRRITDIIGKLSSESTFDVIGFASHGFVIKQLILACSDCKPTMLENCEIVHFKFDMDKYNVENPQEAFSFVERIRTDK